MLPQEDKSDHRSVFVLGIVNVFLIGYLILMYFWMNPDFETDSFWAIFPVYRGVASSLLVLWCWLCCRIILTSYRINYVSILNLNGAANLGSTTDSQSSFNSDEKSAILTKLQFCKLLLIPTTVCSSSFLLFSTHILQSTTPHVNDNTSITTSHHFFPIVMIFLLLFLLFNPLDFYYRSTRLWFFKVVLECFASPFSNTIFLHFFISDFLTSLQKVFIDMEYAVCFYGFGYWITEDGQGCQYWIQLLLPFTAAIPLTIRLMQCLKRYSTTLDNEHLANAGKYFFNMSIYTYGVINNFHVFSPVWSPTRVFWFAGFIVSSLYAFYWDIVMDWGLAPNPFKPKLQVKAPTYFLLRNQLLFRPWVYYTIIALDGIGRFCWAWALTEFPIPYIHMNYHSMIFGFIEILRRSMWGIIRLEHEHLNVFGKSKASSVDLRSMDHTIYADLTSVIHTRSQTSSVDAYSS